MQTVAPAARKTWMSDLRVALNKDFDLMKIRAYNLLRNHPKRWVKELRSATP